jgi:diguanylate cyclase (GGDEF)-like protein/PAS domain S-box-containing protein
MAQSTDRSTTDGNWVWHAAEMQASTEFADDAISIFDLKLRHVFVNRTTEEATGLKMEQVRGRTQAELGFPPELCALWEKMLRHVAATGEVVKQEYEARVPGRTRYLRTQIGPVKAPNGSIQALVAMTRDLTDQRRSETLRENQLEIMRRMVAGAGLADLMNTILRLAQAQVPGRACAILLRQYGAQYLGAGNLTPGLLQLMRPILLNEKTAAPDAPPVVCADIQEDPAWWSVRTIAQQLGWRSAWSQAIRDREGGLLGCVVILHRNARPARAWELAVMNESTLSAALALEHRRSQDIVLESEARYRALSDQPLNLICVTDVHGRILELNEAARTILGYAPQEEIGNSVFNRIHADDRERMRRVFRPLAAKDGVSASAVYRCLHRDGSWRVLEGAARSLRNVRGRRIIMLISRDVTERMRAAQELRQSSTRLQRALEATGLGMWEWNPASDEIQADIRYQLILGYTPGSAPPTARGQLKLIHPGDRVATRDAIVAHLRGDTPFFEVRYRALAANGRWKWVSARGQAAQRDAAGKVLRATGTVRDIDAERRTQENLEQVTRRVQLLLEASDEGIIGLDNEGRCTFANQAAARLLGYELDQMQGKPLQQLVRDEFEGGIEERWESGAVLRCLQHHTRQRSAQDMYWRSAWRQFPVEYTVSPILADDQEGGAVLIFHDASEKRAMAKQLRHQALHDPLTGLVNRRGFETRLEELIASARRENRGHALCFMDLDHFKLINDSCGHTAGDELLRQLPRQFQAVVRSDDVLARLGGDEFGVLLPYTTLEQAAEIADKLRGAVREFRFSWRGKAFSVGVSIGVVAIDAGSSSATAILGAADAACYVAKDQGTNQIHVSRGDDAAVQMRRGEVGWVNRLRAALEEDHFRLYFQSIGDLSSDPPRLLHHEVLLRLRDDSGELVSPGKFMGIAERYQLMPAIDAWVIDRTLKMLGRQLITHPGLREHRVGINLSGDSIRGPQLVENIRESLARYKVPPEMVYFEITETAAINDVQAAGSFMADLRQIGCKLALDDFGSGMSSFTYLKNLPVDFLKIDGSFIRDIEKSSTDESIVRAIHSVGRNMRILTVAEYVETDSVLKLLRDIGIDYAQGYAVAKPLPLEDLPDLVVRGRATAA